jgi:hypothetical protein
MTIAELEQADTQLSEQELARFRAWFDEYYAQIWDKQIEEDAKSGRLDQLLAEVEEESNDLSVIEERCNEPGRPLREYLKEKAKS